MYLFLLSPEDLVREVRVLGCVECGTENVLLDASYRLLHEKRVDEWEMLKQQEIIDNGTV